MQQARGLIVFVPGKNPKPHPIRHRQRLWRALLRGVELYQPQALPLLQQNEDRFVLAAWNRLYYGRQDPMEREAQWIDAFLLKTEANEAERRAARSSRIQTARILYALADRFPFLISLLPDRAVKGTIKDTLRYFNNSKGIGGVVREVVKARLRAAFDRGEPVLLIAHSMGSVIAYDALWELWFEENRRERVDLFLTLGSPLGMSFVQRRLLGSERDGDRRLPGNIRRWANVAAHGDLTAFDPILKDDFAPLLTQKLTESITDYYEDIYTYYRNAAGLNFHRSYGYLAQPAVGELVAKWWRAHTHE